MRENGRWNAYRIDGNGRHREQDLIVPSDLKESEIPSYLDDILHEVATTTNSEIRRIE